MQKKITILQSTRRLMFPISRLLSSCRASNPRNMFTRHLHGCTTTGILPMMELSFWGLIWIFHQKLFLLPWRNRQSLLVVAHLVVHLVTVPGNFNLCWQFRDLSVLINLDFLEYTNLHVVFVWISRGPPRFEGDRPRFGDRDGYRGGPRGVEGGEKGGAPADYQPAFRVISL